MLQNLVKHGVGSDMLNALKIMYANTNCNISYRGKYSEEFRTYSGIRQGTSSSVLLFNACIDDLIEHQQSNCLIEPLLDMLHALLHVDDYMSTSRKLFVKKSDTMIQHFEGYDLLLSILKSGYMIINGKADDTKGDVVLAKGSLEYKRKQTYLSTLITDSGNLVTDKKHSWSIKDHI